MKNPESLRKLLQAMNGFDTAYRSLMIEINDYEQSTGTSVNDVPGFNEHYPFDTSLDELPISRWVDNVVDTVRRKAFKVLNYEYLNTGGNCMVGIFTVWLPALKQTVYALTNEVGCSIVTADYISNEIEIDDYDEVTIDRCDFDELQSNATYFELYRYCLNEYTKSDCRYFGNTIAIPYHLLSDELQSEVHADYLVWCEENNNGCIPTDGEKIIVHPDYDSLFTDPHEDDADLQALKEWRDWHDKLVSDSTMDEVSELYNKKYRITFNGRRIYIPFNADTYSLIDDLIKAVIREW